MDILTVKEVAALLRCSVAQVYRLVERGELSGFRIGRAVRVQKQSIEEYTVRNSAFPANAPKPEVKTSRPLTKNKQERAPGTVSRYFGDLL